MGKRLYFEDGIDSEVLDALFNSCPDRAEISFADADAQKELGNPSSKPIVDMMRSTKYVGNDISNGLKLRYSSYR